MIKRVGWLLAAFISIHVNLVVADGTLPPSDPLYAKQVFLKDIHVDQAWKEQRENQDLIIAVLDTGVDINHPDLKTNLLPGINLISPGQPPVDDQGHGTATTGILAAVGNNGIGGSGVLWKASILPIKVLDQTGNGEAKRVAQGIQTAVDQGAKIILLSLGDPIYSSEMETAVMNAEKKGVLLVSATGNDSDRVNYPGAFPTVLSVGAVDQQGKILSYSNRGPEVDVVAPGSEIFTTARHEKYAAVSGTSMAAPQVAGIAALLLKKNPHLTPAQVRGILKETAKDLGEKGWDLNTGYGLVDAQKALDRAAHPATDWVEPNNRFAQAVALPLISMTDASVGGTEDPVDWYRIEIPYKGNLSIKSDQDVHLNLYTDQQKKLLSKSGSFDQGSLSKGTYYVEARSASSSQKIPYTLTVDFHISADSQEPNGEKTNAKRLSPVERVTVTGNFHRPGDEDWFQANYPWAGNLAVEVTTDTLRMDPVLMIEQAGKWKETVDQGSVSNRQNENWSSNIMPGTFFFQVKDYYNHTINGEYTLSIHYQPQPSKWFQDITYHWARSDIEYLVDKHILSGYSNGHFSPDQPMTRGEAAAVLQRVLHLPNGKESFRDSPSSYWATPALAALVDKGILRTADKNSIYPDKKLTRAELATILARAKYGVQIPISAAALPFKDIDKRHWAYPYIEKMYQAGLAKGVSQTQFAPDQLTTRAEIASLIRRMWFE